eukprot:TRINITY_DN17009_c0_g1_i1.p1 TRINITY_DN17009_c0_g1~~TRINITY_DN17009_c0_g1_i1.p1  ORF type:complete len:643 (+),score=141.16 TRINITY_DN17009_c0_g1_i1:84-1931(+)
MVLQWCCQALVARAAREGDDGDERKRKELLLPLFAIVSAVALIFEALHGRSSAEQPLLVGTIGRHILALGSVTGLLAPLATRRLSVGFAVGLCVVFGVGTILTDYHFAAEKDRFRPWTFVVLIMDVHLALNLPRVWQHVVLHTTAAWVFLTYVDDSYHLGLFTVEGFSDRREVITDTFCSCAYPPCSANLFNVIFPYVVLYIDFFATRGFADGMRAEQGKVLTAVVTAEQVAGALAAFDLGAAGAALDSTGAELPLPLSASFRRLLSNLARYRPYLPQSCFAEGDSGAHSSSASISSRAPTEHRSSGETLETRAHTDAPPASSSSRRSSRAVGAAPLLRTQNQRRVTLLQRNSVGFLNAIRGQGDAVAEWLAAEVERFSYTVSQQGGVSDIISGDHFSASFGAIKVQGSQCTSATRAAMALAEDTTGPAVEEPLARLQSTAAVSCGRALCGSYGSATVQRFMVLGGVSSFVVAAERAAAAWGVAALIDSAVHADADALWSCRLRYCALCPKLNSRPVELWEVMEGRMQSGSNDEWMYELEAAKDNPWEGYNSAVGAWCAGTSDALAAVAKGLDSSPGEVPAAALRALRQALQEGAAAPAGELLATASPSPLVAQK